MQPELFKNPFAKASYRSLLFLHIVGSIVLITLVIAIQIHGLRQSRLQYRERTQLSAQNLGDVLAGNIARAFQNVDLSLFAAIDHIQLHPPRHDPDDHVFNTTLMNLEKRIPWLIEMGVTDPAGNVKFSTDDEGSIPLTVADRDYFKQLKDDPNAGMVISKPLIGRASKKWVVVCARRFTQADGSFGGVMYGSVELEGLVERLSGKRLPIGDQDVITLLDDDANVITRYVHGKQELKPVGRKVRSPDLDALIRSSADTGFYLAESAIDHVERVFYFQRIDGEPLNIVVGLATEEAFSGWQSEVKDAWITSIIFALLASLGSFLIYRTQMRRLQVIADLEDALNFNQRVISSSAVGIQAFDQNGQCILANLAVATMVGGSQEELLRQNFRNLQSWKNCGAMGIAEQALSTGLTHHLQSKVTTSFGKTLWLQWVFTSFSNHGERMLLVMLRDITDIQLVREELEETNRKLAALSATDGLTGIANRRRFDEALMQEWRRTVRVKLPLALAMIDVDSFKLYNDRYGHQAGDDCLRSVARVIAQHASRAGDLVARYGGEEFVFLGSATDSEHATQLAENIRLAVMKMALPHDASSFGCVTVSIGVAVIVPDDEQSPASLVRSADEALYAAKGRGRNQVVLAASE